MKYSLLFESAWWFQDGGDLKFLFQDVRPVSSRCVWTKKKIFTGYWRKYLFQLIYVINKITYLRKVNCIICRKMYRLPKYLMQHVIRNLLLYRNIWILLYTQVANCPRCTLYIPLLSTRYMSPQMNSHAVMNKLFENKHVNFQEK